MSNLHYTPPRGLPPLTPSAITLGLEFEFLLTGLTPPLETHLESAPTSTYALVRRSLAPACDALGIPRPPARPGVYTTFRVKPDASIAVPGDDHAAEAHEPRVAAAGGVEVATPIVAYLRVGAAVRATVAAIRHAAESGGGVAEVNGSCGLHVHVGLGTPYTLEQLRRVAMAVVVFEGYMDLRHAAHRRGGGGGGGGVDYIQSVRDGSVFARDGLATTVQKVEAVAAAETYGALVRLVNPGEPLEAGDEDWLESRWYKYNFVAVSEYGTIEFRQAAGSLDAEAVVLWAERVVRFVAAAVGTEEEMFRGWAAAQDAGGAIGAEVLDWFAVGEAAPVEGGLGRVEDAGPKEPLPKEPLPKDLEPKRKDPPPPAPKEPAPKEPPPPPPPPASSLPTDTPSETETEEEEERWYQEDSVFSIQGAHVFPIIGVAMLPVALGLLWVQANLG